MTQLFIPGGERKPAYDLNVVHDRFERGGVTLWVTWNRNTGEPCLILTPSMSQLSHQRAIPCVVPLSRAWAWDERIGDTHSVMITAGIFCTNLGLNPFEARNVNAVLSLIRNHLHDLLTCPPLPAEDREIAADAIITDNATGKVTHKEIKDHA